MGPSKPAPFCYATWADPVGGNGTKAVTTEAPQWLHRQRGRIPGEPKPAPLSAPCSDALFAPEVHFFCEENRRDVLTLNQRVQGSSPCAPTNEIKCLRAVQNPWHS